MSGKNIQNKYESVFVLHAVGDTIGFKNSDWEFNYNRSGEIETVLEFVFEFIQLGGINGINLKNWMVSDDTLYHIAIGKALTFYKELNIKTIELPDDFISIVKKELISTHNKMYDEKQKKNIYRFPGITTTKILNDMSNEYDARNDRYTKSSGGNGAAMRSLCIGLYFHKETEFEKLVETSIQLSKLTHNAPTGFLAGFTSAYFTSLGMRNISVEIWIKLLLEHLNSPLIKKYINLNDNDEFLDYLTYINNWKIYYDTRFVDDKPLKTRSTSNLIFRLKYFQDNFAKNESSNLGSSGHLAMIMAYDALLDCDGNWEKIVFYSMLHPGDSDTVGAIAGGLYGSVYEYGDVPDNMTKYLEKKTELKKLGKILYENKI